MMGKPELASAICKSPELPEFLEKITMKVLQILSDGTRIKCLAGNIANPPPNTYECHFVKL